MSLALTLTNQRAFFQRGETRAINFRREQLRKLSFAIERHEASLLSALQTDLRKSPFQGYASELGLVQAEIRHAIKNLDRWTGRHRRSTPWLVAPARGWVQPEPLGVALIMGPWNYPVQLLLAPLVSAIAAGNCGVLKPSELAPRTAEAILALARETFVEEFICVVNGGPDVAEKLLAEPFDKIFFTGSTRVGRLVMAAAARHLTPVTLELGGKSPAIVCADADIELSAKRIAWGKFLNAGQTCVAPDFVLVQRGVRDQFGSALKKSLREFYGEDPRLSPDYGRIVNSQHFDRLVSYLSNGEIVYGGAHEKNDLYIAPTILQTVPPEARVMQEEIFGPILPVIEFDHIGEAVASLRAHPPPLALYLFTKNQETQERVLAELRSGGACINDVVSHMIGSTLPFGGVGESGLGAYHGKAGFEAFSHHRSVMKRATWIDTPFRYPPQKLSLLGLKRALRFMLGG